MRTSSVTSRPDYLVCPLCEVAQLRPLEDLPVERDGHGVVVDDYLTVPGRDGLWAAGDCATVTDAKTGKPYPPTVQFALREGRTVAHNIYASVRGRPLEPFHFEPPATLSVMGHYAACAESSFPRGIAQTIDFGYHNGANGDGSHEVTTPAPKARLGAG
jgi:NADH dehydrogenase FAD-containing subunit